MNRRRLPGRGAVALAAALLAAAGAAAQVSAGDERAAIVRERAAVHAEADARDRECRTRFAVTACLDASRQARQVALGRLREREVVLDEADRRQRAAERRARLAGREKEAASSARPSRETDGAASRSQALASGAASGASTPSSSRSAGPRAGPSADPPAAPLVPRAAPRAPREARPQPSEAERRAAEGRSLEAYERRQQDARARRDALDKRNAEQQKSSKPAALPLPDPTASAAR